MGDDMIGAAAGHQTLVRTTGADQRADRGRREIAVSSESVTIRRCLKGIDMRLSLPVTAYRGVALCLREGRNGAAVYQIRLIHQDTDLSVVLDEAGHDDDIIANWRLWARRLRRPALIERQPDIFETARGVSASPSSAATRRKRPLKRRPRFLTRRRMGRRPDVPAVHLGEREIIART